MILLLRLLSREGFVCDLAIKTRYILTTCHMREIVMKLSNFLAFSHVKHTDDSIDNKKAPGLETSLHDSLSRAPGNNHCTVLN